MGKKKYRQISRSQQQEIFAKQTRTLGRSKPTPERPGFVDPNPEDIVVGNRRLNDFLEEMDLHWVLKARRLLRGLDWSAFEDQYVARGRAAYAPAAMVGLILYAIMEGKSSLRQIEQLARRDMGAMWMSGGIFPDHSILGRFIQRHEELLTEAFFEQLTRLIVTKLGSPCRELAGDGTVIESAASRFQVMRLAALEASLKDETEASLEDETNDPDDDESNGMKSRRSAAQIGRERAEASRKTKKQKDATRVCLTDPESTFLKKKNGAGFGPGYVASFLANRDRFIISCAVDPSDELGVLPQLVEQATRVSGRTPERLLLDSNYHCYPVFETAIRFGIDVLVPPKPSTEKPYHQRAFVYDASQDILHCPLNQVLKKQSQSRERGTQLLVTQYRPKDPGVCLTCEAFGECTTSSRGRSVRRHELEWAREAVCAAMKTPLAQKRYNQRMATVEPPIGQMREQQGLGRYARTGLQGATIETVLHAAAYNLRRYARKAAVSSCFFGLSAACIAKCTSLRSFLKLSRSTDTLCIANDDNFTPIFLAA